VTTIHRRPLIAHIVHRFDIGGLENGVVNLINHMPEHKYRHVIICMTDYSDFYQRIDRKGIEIYALHKKDGKDPLNYLRLWRLLRRLKPDISHTRNIATIDGAVIAMLAGIKYRVHGEHGRDIYDVDGSNAKYQRLRRLCQPLIHRFIALSKDLEAWLIDQVGIKRDKVVQLYNGVDTGKFRPYKTDINRLLNETFVSNDEVIFGTVGRFEPIKDQLTLLQAFTDLLEKSPLAKERARLVLVGDGQLKPQLEQFVNDQGLQAFVRLTGKRNDVAHVLQAFDVFVLPSLGEGISNTILEAMASGLPVLATDVGGNAELVEPEVTGQLVPSSRPDIMAKKMLEYLELPECIQKQGALAVNRVQQRFSIEQMVEKYMSVYDALLAGEI